MAHILNIEDVGISLGARPILGDLNLSLEDGARIGVVGPNGGGKSTLLRLMMQKIFPDTGRITMVNGTRFAYLTQQDSLQPQQTVTQAIHGDIAEFEWASEAHIRQIHDGLLPDVALTKKVAELSGGQRRRVALAAALTVPAEVLVLDEPTNHLDLEGVTFLAQHLKQRFTRSKGALVVVTHDRWFLDEVCGEIWEVIPGDDGPGGKNPRPGRVEVYDGGYAAYILQRTERARVAQQDAQKRANLLRKELAWLRRGAPARTAKPKFRIEAANELIAAEPPPRDTLELTRMATSRLGKDVIDLINVDFSWQDENKLTLHDVTLRLAPGERIGILGSNGAGKSSLLGLLNGTLSPQKGKVKCGQTVVLATLSQDTKELQEVADKRVVEAVQEIASHIIVGKRELSAGQLVERLGFTRERAWTRVSELSGGERRRLQLLRLLMGEPNVLLLDEPTNDLDTDTLAAIEDLLDSWPGTLVVVSHDRYLLERITDRQVAVIDGSVRDLPRGVEEYLELSRDVAVMKKSESAVAEKGNQSAEKSKNAAKERLLQKKLEKIMRKIEKLNQTKETLGVTQTELAMTGDYAKLADLGKEISEIEMQIAQLETEWMMVAESLAY